MNVEVFGNRRNCRLSRSGEQYQGNSARNITHKILEIDIECDTYYEKNTTRQAVHRQQEIPGHLPQNAASQSAFRHHNSTTAWTHLESSKIHNTESRSGCGKEEFLNYDPEHD
ncbi:Hypothetical predicted protein [Octopus vulgaris]|uniref:Uncharacterized protein n=1 Tax=Octopus vulgaris TaxID=6645 RepID=A0AA36BMK8_OCTVU|nr:Hypothetical predicted protein [Octopus vulgaris]